KLIATSTLAAGVYEFSQGHWLSAVELCDRASITFRERCIGVWWHQYMAASFSLWGLTNSGRLTELSQRAALWSAEASARGIPYLETLLQMRPGLLTRLAANDPEGARRRAEDALKRWSRAGFHVQHYQERTVQCYVDMYLGDGVAAHRRIL